MKKKSGSSTFGCLHKPAESQYNLIHQTLPLITGSFQYYLLFWLEEFSYSSIQNQF